jgi:uncharacterized damage-inducible protein DinB
MPTAKARLRALLAAERSGLLSQLLDLNVRTLSCEPVWEGWTAKDILAHVAAWDELFTKRTELALAGRAADIVPVDLDAHGAEVHVERKSWSFEQALEACLTARKVYLDSFARVAEDDLDRPISIPSSETQSIRQWAEWRYQHDAEHAGDLAAWRQRLAAPGSTGPKSLLQAALRAARKELLTAEALVPMEERETRPIRGDWTLKDVLAYVADQERLCLDGVRPMAAPETTDTASQLLQKAWSHENVEALSSRSWEDVWRDLHATHQELLRLLDSLSQEDVERLSPSPSGSQDTVYSWIWACVERDREHAAELRAVLTI